MDADMVSWRWTRGSSVKFIMHCLHSLESPRQGFSWAINISLPLDYLQLAFLGLGIHVQWLKRFQISSHILIIQKANIHLRRSKERNVVRDEFVKMLCCFETSCALTLLVSSLILTTTKLNLIIAGFCYLLSLSTALKPLIWNSFTMFFLVCYWLHLCFFPLGTYIAHGAGTRISSALQLGCIIWILKLVRFTLSCSQRAAEKTGPSTLNLPSWHGWSALQAREAFLPEIERNYMNWRASVWPAKQKMGLTKLGHLCLLLLH